MDRIDSQEELKRIKKNIENSYQGFCDNYESFTKWRNFIFVDTLSDGNKSVNNQIQRPNVQVNLLEAYLSRLCGEISKNEPCPAISSSDDYMPKNDQDKQIQDKQIDVLEGYARHLLQEANKSGLEFNLLRDTFSGGMSSIKLVADYISPKSFIQDLSIKGTYDQTLVGFDLLATEPDKSDGDFCYEIIPMRYEDFHREFRDIDLSDMKYAAGFPMKSGQNNLGPFNWSYKVGDERIILVCDYYEKVRTKKKLMKLTDGTSVLGSKELKEHLSQWDKGGPFYPEQAPEIKHTRMTEVTKIVRHRLIQNKIIKTEDTSFYRLPIKFMDGNSIVTKDDNTGSCHQMTKPFFYQAEGAQRLKNFSIQCLCDELENMRPAQIIASLESIPENYIDAYREPKNTTTLVYYQFKDGNPQVPLNPPQIAQRSPIPPEILEASTMADTLIQNILGASNVSNVPMTDSEMSGKAIQEVLSAGISSARPYIVNYCLAVQSAVQDVIDMMPLYRDTPRSLPVITKDGKRSAVMINTEGGVQMDYEPGAFNVKVEMGASFGVQQSKSLQQITAMMHANPGYGEFIVEDCLDLIVDSMEVRHKDEFSRRASVRMQKIEQMKQMAMQQQQNQPNIEQMAMEVAKQQVQAEHQVGMAKVQQSAQSDQIKAQLKMEELALKQRELEVEVAKVVSELRIEEEKLGIEQQKADDQRVTTVLDAAIKTSEHTHGLSDKHFAREVGRLDADRAHEMAERAEKQVYDAEMGKSKKGSKKKSRKDEA